jgi:hypothetical protein
LAGATTSDSPENRALFGGQASALLAGRADHMLKTLKHARLDNSH